MKLPSLRSRDASPDDEGKLPTSDDVRFSRGQTRWLGSRFVRTMVRSPPVPMIPVDPQRNIERRFSGVS